MADRVARSLFRSGRRGQDGQLQRSFWGGMQSRALVADVIWIKRSRETP